ncbi:citrate lyase subunit beta/citryl-CoA lyase [Homoserinimonas aerilata]|uniref:Citrate lyase subunit beta/citryl-CoA lyase n=1 Tax=Homoserinimonas aerilata TaxID=1162970 RepID=A0A542YI03_9MICO|nr:CoA ester lyase [Homoserinimonas aerilata]TQL47726.1 citrate lyase subunit beta/citryl-CoA lyase [Homoserinimonas aerilata]
MTFAMGPAILFCPADRPERYEKAAERADAVILDLEDAVAPAAKAAARESLFKVKLDPARTIVRVNRADGEHFAADLAALAQTGYRTVMLAKAESERELLPLADYAVIALIETAIGVQEAPRIAAASNAVGLMWGAEDLIVSLGGTGSRHPDGSYRDVARHARASVLLAAGAQGKAAIDAVHVDISDTDGLSAEATDAAASGFTATACIHPSQVPVIREAYRPNPDEVAWARHVVEAAAQHGGAFKLDGRMVDEPVIRHAERMLRRAQA